MTFRTVLKEEWRTLVIYVAILAIFLAELNGKISDLKTELNTTARIECLNSMTNAIFAKYNDVVESQIAFQKQSVKISLRHGDAVKAALESATATRLHGDLIALVKPDCSNPLLP